MKKRVTMTDVAEAAGISQSAVSLILNEKQNYRFSEETIAKVRKACADLGYAMPATVRAPSGTILIISENLVNSYYTHLAQTIENAAHSAGFHSLVCNANRSAARENDYIDMALQMRVAGIIFLACPHSPERVNEVAKDLPIVAISDKTSLLSIDIVEMDNLLSAELVIDHLVELGHKRILYLGASPKVNLGRQMRIKGLKDRMAHHGLSASLFVHTQEVDWKSEMSGVVNDYSLGYDFIYSSDAFRENATAYIGMTDTVARGMADALIEQGKQIPEDYSICGFDNYLYSRLLPLSITTIDPHSEQKALSAFELLQRKIQIMNAAQEVDFSNARLTIEHPPTLIARSSTGPVPGAGARRKKPAAPDHR